MKYILSHLTLKKQIDLINLKGTLRQYTLLSFITHFQRIETVSEINLNLIPDNLTIFFQCIGRNKGGVCNLRRYFRFGTILKIMNQIPVPQLVILC